MMAHMCQVSEGVDRKAATKCSRSAMLRILRDEASQILRRAADPACEKPRYGLDNLEWYLDLSKDWAIITLCELSKQPVGTLLDIGAGYGLVSGVVSRLGWRVSAVDTFPIPNFSGLAVESRKVHLHECNVSVDPLPFSDGSFNAVLLNEVLEHLVYTPSLLFKEIRRVLLPQGKLYLTTPNPAALSKLIRLARGLNNEPHLEVFWREDDAYFYKGLMFFKSFRETRIWTVGEIRKVLLNYGLKVVDTYYYGNTVGDGHYLTQWKRLRFKLNGLVRPVVKRNRLFGGGTFVLATAT